MANLFIFCRLLVLKFFISNLNLSVMPRFFNLRSPSRLKASLMDVVTCFHPSSVVGRMAATVFSSSNSWALDQRKDTFVGTTVIVDVLQNKIKEYYVFLYAWQIDVHRTMINIRCCDFALHRISYIH